MISISALKAEQNEYQQDIDASHILNPQVLNNTLGECKPVFSFNHILLNCLEALEVDELPMPNVYSQCGNIADLSYVDEYFEIGCHVKGFDNWFQKDNWIQSKIKGDGGVDVTGAPNALLVEGANKALVEVMPGSMTSLTVVVPADGFITFDWSIVGGSNLSFTVRAGESTIIPDRYFVSQSLKAGDTFTLLFQSTFQDQQGIIELSNFQFLSNVRTVIQRIWSATDENGNYSEATQFIGIKGIEADQILMPLDVDASKASYRQEIPSPEQTGFPIFDRDGDWATSDDQISLQGKSCPVKMSWVDDVKKMENEIIIKRKWTIEQGCGRNTIIQTQEIRLHNKYSEQSPPVRKGIGDNGKKNDLGLGDTEISKRNYYSFTSEESPNDSN